MKKDVLPVLQANGLLLATFLIYLGFSWLSRHDMVPGGPFAVLFIGQILLGIPSLLYIKLKGMPVKETLRLHPIDFENVKMAALVIICAYPLVGVLNFVTMLFVENAVTGVIDYFMPYGLYVGLFMLAFLPAVNEEILCRGMLYHAYSHKAPLKGVLLSAFVFGLFHLNLNQFPYAVLLGVIFALMNEATGSALTSVLMHFLLNGFNVLLNFAAARQGLTRTDAAAASLQEILKDPETLKMTVISGAIIVAILLPMTIILIRRTFKMNHRTFPAGKGRLADPMILIFLAAAVFLTWKNTVFLF